MNREFIERVREAVDIVDVISDYVELKKTGKQYRGLCPFHKEKTPSFYVDPEKGVYHCFGCGASGNVFRFLMDIEKITFHEAVLQLAKRAGIEPPKEGKKGELSRPLRLVQLAADFYHKNLFLPEGKRALAYLRKRGIRIDTATYFKLGYALPDGRSFLKHAVANGFSEDEVVEAGLATKRENRIFDTFRDRLMFPIRSVGGTVIAFGGRALSDSSGPKYLNSPDTPFFKKGETLYGLYEVKGHLREKNVAIIVEGYMDFLMLYQGGLRYAVAPLGTALTEQQALVIGRYAKRVFLLYDGDEAGRKAAKRALPILLAAGLQPKVAFLPEGEDPASLLAGGRRDVVIDALRSAMDTVDFFFPTEVRDIGDTGEMAETLNEALLTLASASDELYQEILLRKLSERTGLDMSVLKGKIRTNRKEGTSKRKVYFFEKYRIASGEFRNVLWGFKNEKVRDLILQLDEDCFEDQMARELFNALKEGKILDDLLSEGSKEMRSLISNALIGMDSIHLDEGDFAIIEKFVREKLSKRVAKELANSDKVDEKLRRLMELKKEGSPG